jgi:hypothetical protein
MQTGRPGWGWYAWRWKQFAPSDLPPVNRPQSTDDFIKEWGPSISPVVFLGELAEWPVGFYPQARVRLHRLREKCRVGCLSDANAIQ